MRLPKRSDLTAMTDIQLERMTSYIADEQLKRDLLANQEKHALEELEALAKKYNLDLSALGKMII